MSFLEATNPTLIALIVGAFLSFRNEFINSLPKLLWGFLLKNFTITIINPESCLNVHKWAKDKFPNKRYAKYSPYFDRGNAKVRNDLEYNTTYWFRYHCWIKVICKKEKEDSFVATWQITFFTKNHLLVDQYLKDLDKYNTEDSATKVYFGPKTYKFVQQRTLDSIFLPSVTKNLITKEIENFQKQYEFYRKHKIPYKRTFMLYGPPGTGKSSMAKTMAGYLGTSIFVVNSSALSSESNLDQYWEYIAGNVVGINMVLIEDIDCYQNFHERQSKSTSNSKDSPKGVSLSSFLNKLDGAQALENVIIVMTTNDPSKLDAALTRSGRVDVKIELGLMQPSESKQMLETFFPDMVGKFDELVNKVGNTKSPAWWQELALKHLDEPGEMMEISEVSG